MEHQLDRTDDRDARETVIVHEEREDASVIHVFGEFTFLECPRIEHAIVASVRIGRRTLCNVLGVSHLDAAGVGVLLRARDALGDAFTVVAPQTGIVGRMLDLCDAVTFRAS